MKYYYEYKIKNGAKVGGHNLEKIIIKDDVIILEGVDVLMDCDGEYDHHWKSIINNVKFEYLKIEPMEEDKDIEEQEIIKNKIINLVKERKEYYDECLFKYKNQPSCSYYLGCRDTIGEVLEEIERIKAEPMEEDVDRGE